MKKLYVGNLPWRTDDEELREIFSAYGEVQSATVITDRDTGRSRGFGFVEMDDEGAGRALSEADGHPLDGRPLKVSEAKERESSGARGPRGGGGGGRF